MRARGEPPAGGWRVPVEHPLDPSAPAFVHPLAGGALVSSTRRIRAWERGGREYHHIIDPRTGDSTRTPIVAVVAAAGDAWWAEGIAKAIMIAGVDDGSVLARSTSVRVWMFLEDGQFDRGRAVITIAGAVDSKLSWYAARSSGLVAWAVVTASIVCGLVVSTRLIRRKGVPAWFLDLHKFLGTLSVLFVAVHLFALWADNFVYFGPTRAVRADGLFVAARPGGLGHRRDLSPRRDPADVVDDAEARRAGCGTRCTSRAFPMFVFATVHGVHRRRRQHQPCGAVGRARPDAVSSADPRPAPVAAGTRALRGELVGPWLLLHEAREPAVGEHLAAGLAVRAVHDLVRLVRHALQVVAAHRAREAGLAVHGEVLTELVRRQAAGRACARARDRRRAPRGSRRAGARARRRSATSATRTARAGARCSASSA